MNQYFYYLGGGNFLTTIIRNNPNNRNVGVFDVSSNLTNVELSSDSITSIIDNFSFNWCICGNKFVYVEDRTVKTIPLSVLNVKLSTPIPEFNKEYLSKYIVLS